MEATTVLAIGGVVLLILGVLGGGIEVQTVKVATIPGGLRILSSLVGTVLIMAGILLPSLNNMQPPTSPGDTNPTVEPIPAVATTALGSTDEPEISPSEAIASTTEPTLIATPTTGTEPDYFDDFTNGTTLWPINNLPDNEYTTEKATVINGVYRWEVIAHKSAVARVKPDLPAVSNFEVQTDIRLVSGKDGAKFGITLRGNPAGSYRFLIDSEGLSRFLSYEVASTTWKDLIEPRKASPYKPGLFNTFRIDASGPRIRTYINDQLVAEVVDSQYTSGSIGVDADFSGGDSTILEIDNFRLILK